MNEGNRHQQGNFFFLYKLKFACYVFRNNLDGTQAVSLSALWCVSSAIVFCLSVRGDGKHEMSY